MLRSLPTARLHTLPRTLGGIPCHHSSLTRLDVHLWGASYTVVFRGAACRQTNNSKIGQLESCTCEVVPLVEQVTGQEQQYSLPNTHWKEFGKQMNESTTEKRDWKLNAQQWHRIANICDASRRGTRLEAEKTTRTAPAAHFFFFLNFDFKYLSSHFMS